MTTQYREDPEHNLVEIIIDGKVTKAEYDEIMPRFEAFIKAHGPVKILEDIRHYDGFDASLWWEGAKFDFKHMKDYSHCAVVSDLGWLGPFARFFGAILPCEVRTFKRDELDAARQWLKSVETVAS